MQRQSLIVGHTGWPIGGPASYGEEEIIYARCNLDQARRQRVWNEHNRVLHDRRSAGIHDFHFHDLRHTFASHLVMRELT